MALFLNYYNPHWEMYNPQLLILNNKYKRLMMNVALNS